MNAREVILTFRFEDADELAQWRKEHGDIYDYMFAEICQNHDFGFLAHVEVKPAE